MKAISLFSGAGGLDVGFESADFKIIWANDSNKHACATYTANRDTLIKWGPLISFVREALIEKATREGAESWVEQYHKYLLEGGKPLAKENAPDFLRRLTIEESSRIQMFPLGYIFRGPTSAIYEQIGNAVPCGLATAVAKGLKEILDNEDTKNFLPVRQEESVQLSLL